MHFNGILKTLHKSTKKFMKSFKPKHLHNILQDMIKFVLNIFTKRVKIFNGKNENTTKL